MAQTKTTELQAVNTLLTNIGQAPTTELDTTNPQVSMAQRVLAEVSNDVQAEGWTFNSEPGFPFHPDVNTKFIYVPENVLRIDAPNGCLLDVVVRNGRLYDRIAHTDLWKCTQFLDVVWNLPWNDIPESARKYITIRAANLFAMRATGSVEVAKYSEREEAASRAALTEWETQQGDYNIFSNGLGMRPDRGYNTLDTIWRY